jgi:anti-anti-sigma regulatory factor
MSGCRIDRETEDGRTIIRVSGVFDSQSACELSARLAREQEDDVVLDFSLVREFADLGVAELARGLADHRPGLSLRGLRQHQARIFRYFGVDVDSLEQAGRNAS